MFGAPREVGGSLAVRDWRGGVSPARAGRPAPLTAGWCLVLLVTALHFGDDAPAGEPEALGLNRQGAGPGSAPSASLGGDGLVRLWPSGTLDLTPGHRGLLPPSLKGVGRLVPPAWGQEHLALSSGASCPGTGTQHSEGAAPGAQRLTSQGEKLGSTRGRGASGATRLLPLQRP